MVSCKVELRGRSMKTVHEVFQYVILGVSVIGSLVVVWGVTESIVSFTAIKFSKTTKELFTESEAIRQRLGSHLLLGLEIFIGGDIIASVVSPSWESVGILAAIVGVRTVLSYFLHLELKQGIR